MEKSVNKVELNGFVGANPEVLPTKNGGKFVRFTMATNESYKSRNGEWVKETTWHNIVVWNKLADEAEAQVKKGCRVALTGKLVNRNYTDKEGKKHYIVEIQAISIEVVPVTAKEEQEAA